LDSGTADPEFIQVMGRAPRLDGEDEGYEEGDDDPAPADANLKQPPPTTRHLLLLKILSKFTQQTKETQPPQQT
jgi:hypothetical protein